jgi:hypothetical protein
MTLFSTVFAVAHATLSGCCPATQTKLNFATCCYKRRLFDMCAFHCFPYLPTVSLLFIVWNSKYCWRLWITFLWEYRTPEGGGCYTRPHEREMLATIECRIVCPLLGAFAKLRKVTASSGLSLSPTSALLRGTAGLPLDEFSWSLIS